MSTSAESALQWLDEKQPNNQQIQDVITKLKQRIEHSGAPEAELAGSIEALTLLQDVMADRLEEDLEQPLSLSTTPEPQKEASPIDSALDFTPLGEPASEPAEHLNAQQKRDRFESLKASLSLTKSKPNQT